METKKITIKELRIAAKKIKLQYGVIDILIVEAIKLRDQRNKELAEIKSIAYKIDNTSTVKLYENETDQVFALSTQLPTINRAFNVINYKGSQYSITSTIPKAIKIEYAIHTA